MSQAVTPQELDDALDAGVVRLGRCNRRVVRCVVAGCRLLRDPGHAWRLFVDGHPRGFCCEDCFPPGSFLPLPKGP